MAEKIDAQTRVFISYSRTDLETAERLRARLIEDGFDAYLDTYEIVKGDPWKERLKQLLEQCDLVLFLISPESVTSEVCDWEINEAELLGKRIFPALVRPTGMDVIPPRLQRLQISFLETEARAEEEYPKLLAAMKQDAAWVREHSRLGELALRWERAGKPSRLLLRGADVEAAETWRAQRTPSAPELTARHHAYLTESRAAGARRLRWWAAGTLMIAAAMAALALVAFQQRAVAIDAQQEAEAERDRATKNAELAQSAVQSIIFDFVQGFENIEGVTPASMERLLQQARATLDGLLARDPDNPALQRQKAAMLSKLGDVYRRIGRIEEAAAAYAESLEIDRALAAAEPENTQLRRDVSVSLDRIGNLRLRQGDVDGALAAYVESLEIRRALAAAEPENTQFRRDVSVSLSKIGDLRLRQGDVDGALAAYAENLEIDRALAAAEPESAQFRRDVSVTLNQIGNLRLRQGDFDGALAAYAESLEINRALAAAEPENTQFRRDVSVSLDRIGDLRLRQGDVDGAQAAYAESLEIRRALAAAEPENTQFRRGVGVSLSKIGDLRLRQGDVDGALAAYEESLGIRRALAAAEPENTQFRRDVGVSLSKTGDLRLRQNDVDGAQAAYTESLEIFRTLAAAEPENIQFRRDVSVSLEKIGDLRRRQGDVDEALTAYEESLEIDRALAAAEPRNVQAQTDLVVSLMKIHFATSGPRSEAALREAAAIVFELDAKGLLSADQKPWIEDMKKRLAELDGE